MELIKKERADLERIKSSIDLRDSKTALTYGAPAQKDLAQFADSVLSKVRAKDSGEVGNLLTELVTKVRGLEKKPSFISRIPVIGNLVNGTENLVTGYQKLSTQVEKITRALEGAKLKLLEDIQLFDTLYDKNLEYFNQLELYIVAGEEKLQELREKVLPEMKLSATKSNDPMKVQQVADFEQSVERFEKKLHDLKLSKSIAVQTAPQIRLIQNNDKVLIDRVQSALFQTIPLWKNQMVIALGLSRQQEVLQMQRAITDATNDLLRRNAELLKQNTLEVARENERGIIDIETVKKVNDDLISTIQETLTIQREGRAKRAEAERELLIIESQLKKVLLENSNAQS